MVQKHILGRVLTLGVVLGVVLPALVQDASLSQADHIPYNPGDVFAAVGNGKIKHFRPDGALLEVLDTTTGSPRETGLAFDRVGNLYTTNLDANSMSRFSHQGRLLGPFGGSFNSGPESVVFDASGNAYVGEFAGARRLLKFDAVGNLLATYQPAIEARGIDAITLDSDQCTIFYTSEGAAIKRFNVCLGTQLPDFATVPPPAYGLGIRRNGEILVTTRSTIFRLTAQGQLLQTYTVPEPSLFALTLDPNGTSFWTGNYDGGQIFKVNIATGAIESSFNADLDAFRNLGGLAVYREIVAAEVTATPTHTATSTPTPTATVTPTQTPTPTPSPNGRVFLPMVTRNRASGW